VALQAQIAALNAEFAAVEQEGRTLARDEKERDDELVLDRARMAKSRRSVQKAEPSKK
jgi:hypothetical protein